MVYLKELDYNIEIKRIPYSFHKVIKSSDSEKLYDTIEK